MKFSLTRRKFIVDKKKLGILFLAGIVLSMGLFAVSAQMCWQDFKVRVLWCMDLPEGGGQDTCFQGAIIGYMDCLEHATYDQANYMFGAKILSVKFMRAKGKPEKETAAFSVSEGGGYYINIANGLRTSGSETQVSSAKISVDGKTVLAPDDLNKNVLFKAIPVNLTAGEHSLTAELRSKPGAFITIVVSDKDMTGLMN